MTCGIVLYKAKCQTVDWEALQLFDLNAVVALEGGDYFTR